MPKAINFVDMTGQKHGRLTALSPVMRGHRTYWLCRCECGTETTTNGNNLRRGLVQSCGCLQREARLRSDNKYKKHGCTRTPTFGSWMAMRYRCARPSDKSWADYGGRGIQVCERWRDSFANFLQDMGERPPGHTIDRKDVNGHYEPSNCCWSAPKQQMRNRRDTRSLCVNGQTRPIAEWSEISGIGVSTIRERLRRGWSCEQAVHVRQLPKGLAFLNKDSGAIEPRASAKQTETA